ncbi:GCLC isoform 13, partial [Pan troglodytes]
ETKRHADHVRRHGILQFLHIYHAVKDRHKDVLKWGDEVEYMLVSFDHENKKVRLVLSGEKVLETLQEKGERTNPNHPTLWRPEYGSYMIEGTPGQPYGGTMSEFNTVEANMRKRRKEATSILEENQALCTITSFPSTLTRNIRHRRGEKVVINVPIFKDKNTPSPFIETFPE